MDSLKTTRQIDLNLPRPEHPRPDFRRESWMSLNGKWEFSFEQNTYDKEIIVPFACETKLSGIEDKDFHYTVWYRKEFFLPGQMKGKIVKLHFGAVDYACSVWINQKGPYIHTGGQSPFQIDITDALCDGRNIIELKAEDDPADLEMPRGKQHWERKPGGIFYSRTTGIWQSVWLEAMEEQHLCACRMTPLFDEKAVLFEYELSTCEETELEIELSFQGQAAADIRIAPGSRKGKLAVNIDQSALKKWHFYEDLTWSPETPRLFDVVFRVFHRGELTDTVYSYFGMRKVSVENGVFMLNNRPYYQKLVLDQGYWEDSLLTAPADEDFVRDIELVKKMGFNGVRKHQKAEDPRFLYHADRMGLLVWGEIGSAYLYSREYAARMYKEWMEILERDYNHPCIVAWTPLNESWGVQEIKTDKMQQYHSLAMVALTKSLDTTRVVTDNDGWEHTQGDLLTVHDYADTEEALKDHVKDMNSILKLRPGGRDLFARGWGYQGQPVLVTEFGGIKYAPEDSQEGSWGYCETSSAENYAGKLRELVGALQQSEIIQGYCYTQLTDVETEQNGLLTYRREPKIPLEQIRRINEGKSEQEL